MPSISPSLTPHDFVDKWRNITVTERAGSQSHFNDLCDLLGVPKPLEADPKGEWFAFEKGATKAAGGQGWADVWKSGCFGWEYKGRHGNLDKAYDQLLQYQGRLGNPPLLIVCDINMIILHRHFTNFVDDPIRLTLDDLLDPHKLDLLRKAFADPEALRPGRTTEHVTQEAARRFGEMAERLRKWGHEPQAVAHFLIRLPFCLFAEDVGILPAGLFTRLVTAPKQNAKQLQEQLRQLFAAMASGGYFGVDCISHVDGGLFNDDAPLANGGALLLDGESLRTVAEVSRQDWGAIEPAILGTLFERGLDPGKRSQQGAHFTSKDDILLIVEPVLMAPLRRRWAEVKAEADALVTKIAELDAAVVAAKGGQKRISMRSERTKARNKLRELLASFRRELAAVQVLDPACGSGNFLYVSLRLVLDLEKEVIALDASTGASFSPPLVGPEQLHGIEINPYARELAQATIWIGYIQWRRDNGFGLPEEPILKPLDAIRLMDAILAYDELGRPVEPEWPAADVIVGNPPFLGGKRLRSELGDKYVDDLFALYDGRVPREADLVTYWFEKARAEIEAGRAKRAGLLATQAIRGGANRKVLERIKESGDIFFAVSDRDWVLDGATVHVSMLGFDQGAETERRLNGVASMSINANLTSKLDTTLAKPLVENANIAFMGTTKGGRFDLNPVEAAAILRQPINPNGKFNADVVLPWVNGIDLTQRNRCYWIIDFGTDMSENEAALYEAPFEFVQKHVKPERETNKRALYRQRWWLHAEARSGMREALKRCPRYIGTPRVSKHRLFVWLARPTLPDSATIVFARSDDYFFGVLHSRPHELWARATGTQLREAESGFRYTPTTTFETYPFPWSPGQEPPDDPRVKAIADAAAELVAKRDAWLNPPGASEAELAKRTLTRLYNERPAWLRLLHEKLDAAVLDAYGWPHDLSDEGMLERLLTLNFARSGGHETKA